MSFIKAHNNIFAETRGKWHMKLTSDAFKDQEMIPVKYTCDGENVSPPLTISDLPREAESFALIVEDPDAPTGTFTHWVMYNIPAKTEKISENIPDNEKLIDGSIQGANDFGKVGYGGPCPPLGTHRYFFKLFALNAKLEPVSGMTKDQLENGIKQHVIGNAELIGLYSRK